MTATSPLMSMPFTHTPKWLTAAPSMMDICIRVTRIPVRINACAEAPGANDPRRKDRGANVPVVRVLTEGDVLTSFSMRRDDSDAPGDLYRLYEVAGSSHMDASYYRHLPLVEDQTKMGQPAFTSAWPIAYKCDIDIAITDAPLVPVRDECRAGQHRPLGAGRHARPARRTRGSSQRRHAPGRIRLR